MLTPLKRLVRGLTALTPFELRRRLPVATLDPVTLLLACYQATGQETTILQVGAYDGTYGDPIHDYVINGCARAILIEPNPSAFARLQEAYAGRPNVTLIQAAIGSSNGEAKFYRKKKTDGSAAGTDWRHQIASFDRGHLLRHGIRTGEIEQITVASRTLASLVGELHLSEIDLLQIDAEGFDAAVVRMALKLRVPPKSINFEHVHLRSEDRQPLFDLLKANGYLLAYDAWNILALQGPVLGQLRRN